MSGRCVHNINNNQLISFGIVASDENNRVMIIPPPTKKDRWPINNNQLKSFRRRRRRQQQHRYVPLGVWGPVHIWVALSLLLRRTPPSFQQCRRAAEVAAFVRLPSRLGQTTDRRELRRCGCNRRRGSSQRPRLNDWVWECGWREIDDAPRGRGWWGIIQKVEMREGRANGRRESSRCQPSC
jgi:hypothetical protein